ncbi:MAG: hypothetical protein ACREL1_00370 [bacterium]
MATLLISVFGFIVSGFALWSAFEEKSAEEKWEKDKKDCQEKELQDRMHNLEEKVFEKED